MSNMRKKIAYLFPAFTMRYEDCSRDCLDGYLEEAEEFLEKASAVVEIDRRKFDMPGECTLHDEFLDDLQEQYLCYLEGCAMASMLWKRGVSCDYVTGYSMGLFAALHHSQALSFEDGLRLVHFARSFAHDATQDDEYGMGLMVGLTPGMIVALITEHCREVEVADVCGRRVVVASGKRSEVERLLEVAENEGCLHTKMLPVSVPFHSSFLRPVEERMRTILGQVQIKRPACPIVSNIDQELLTTEDDVREEVARNVFHTINWFETMNRLLDLDASVFVECGLSEGLCKLARNIKGEYQIYHARQFDQLFATLV